MDQIHSEVSRFLRTEQIGRECPTLAAVSGGADSIALVHVLASLGQVLALGHVHHGLRQEEADRDLAFARRTARELGIPFVVERVDAGRRDGRSPEARARHLRYRALESLRRREGLALVATAHTLEDQAETVLLRAVRGASPAGLGGVRPREGRVIRPLLQVRRGAVRAYLEERGLSWREDSTNADVGVPRNRIRHEVMPALEAAHPGALSALVRLADASRELREWLDEEAARALEGARSEREGLWVPRGRIAGLPPPLRMHTLAQFLARAGLGGSITREHLRRVERLLLSENPNGRVSLPGGRTLALAGGELFIGAAGSLEALEVRGELIPPRAIDVPNRGLRLEWHRVGDAGAPRPGPWNLLLPAPIEEKLLMRSPSPNDRMRLAGESHPRGLKELFRRARWSSRSRQSALVVTWRGEVVWVVGLAAADLPRAGRTGGWDLRATRVSSPGATC